MFCTILCSLRECVSRSTLMYQLGPHPPWVSRESLIWFIVSHPLISLHLVYYLIAGNMSNVTSNASSNGRFLGERDAPIAFGPCEGPSEALSVNALSASRHLQPTGSPCNTTWLLTCDSHRKPFICRNSSSCYFSFLSPTFCFLTLLARESAVLKHRHASTLWK